MTTHLCMRLAFLMLAISLSTPSLLAQNTVDSNLLELGKSINASFKGKEVHGYLLELPNNQFVQGEVDQLSVDAVISVYDPKGQILSTIDGPARGKERFQFISESGGSYRIEVQAYEGELGTYEIVINHLAPLGKSLEEKMDQLMSNYDSETPGAVIAVRQNGKILFEKGYGASNLEYDAMLGPESVFYIASVSKQFTAFAIALLEAEDKLTLDDKVQDYLPELKYLEEDLKIRQLIHHTSGLREYYGLLSMNGTRDGDYIRQSDILDLIYKQQELNFTPGTEYLYSNSGYALLATIVERISGQSFSRFMEEEVFGPLGMSDSYVGDLPERITKNRVDSYYLNDSGSYEKYVAPSSGYGAGGIYSSGRDMGKWLSNFDHPIDQHENAIAQMSQRGTTVQGDTLAYAFGLRWMTNKSHQILGHGGDRAGFHAYVGRVPDSYFSVMVLSNVDGFNPTAMAMNIIDTHLPSPPEKSSEKKTGKESTSLLSLGQMETYVGEYELKGGTLLSITLDQEMLFARMATTPRVGLTALNDTLFKVEVPNTDVRLSFHVQSNGSVDGGMIYEGNPIAFERRVKRWQPAEAELASFVGQFRSPELDLSCELIRSKGRLVFRHPIHGDFPLIEKAKDHFSALGWTFKMERGANNNITGFRTSNDRVRNLLFVKEESGR